ncbi:MAG: DNA internalization-related competence protein ComEC/Rec2 [Sphingomonadaceae bacterium]
MTGGILAFAAGVLLLQQQAALPPAACFWAVPGLVVLVVWSRVLRLPAALALGFLWAAGCAQLRMDDRLAPGLEGRDLEVTGVVAGLPVRSEAGLSFELDVERSAGGERLPRRLRLGWYPPPGSEPPTLEPGERWRLGVRLRRPHGHVNPHGFDYELWLLERGVGATGSVRAELAAERLGLRGGFFDRIERLRAAVRERFFTALGETPAAGILAALAVGEQRAISNEEWRLFRRTGVTHLMSISGLHVTLISGLVAWLAALGWRAFGRRAPRLARGFPTRKIGAAAAVAAALGYTLLAGSGVPAQRTLLMVSVVAAALWSGRIASPARSLALALAAVLALDPWAVLAPGFWLSFGAVALIFYVAAGWTEREPWLAQWLRIQWAITLGLAPAALLLFGQVSLVGPLANALAIPLVSAVITPLALAAAVLPSDGLLRLAAWLTERLLEFLEWCAALPAAVWQSHVPPLWSVPLALAGVAWVLAPRGTPWRATGLALMLPAFALPAPAPAPGEAWLSVLDAGQGLAVLVRTAGRALLYDAGPSYGAQADAGERIVVPFLQAEGVTRLDTLILSHDDADHAGGAISVMENLETDLLLSSLPGRHAAPAFAAAAARCARGTRWQWDGVEFALLHPAPVDYRTARRGNDLSCVLRVSAAGHSALLTADIERAAEAQLVAREGRTLRAELLLVPHHGSRSSSSPAFLAAVAPRWAVVTAGYRNRFRHPAEEVVERYRAAGAALLRTDLEGAVSIRLGAGGIRAEAERRRTARYWRGI